MVSALLPPRHDVQAPSTLAKFHAPEVVFGADSVGEAGYAAIRLGARRPFLVTDPGIIEAGWVSLLLAVLKEEGLAPIIWSEVTPNPKDHEIRRAHALYAEQECDVIIAIGGGSVIDAAKLSAVGRFPWLSALRRSPLWARHAGSLAVSARCGRPRCSRWREVSPCCGRRLPR
ncbi:iron-containing alcohol dehydrogenase [Knoellia subterranea]|uniref:Alcohol dehydrogenase iron-type/glycerol dehydrogenase GldA domain-containing protein n=1 Tax=Knoellia subterranea KCTC 19937 TaxID=1385521 RepID=A0A0A0JNZ8_9MICO|nr:iron-containing alcohol dehydrogenase [Knoellia subterranea]KGN38878.1 hypothetical protein N803_08545 [Knoellia subterranea KCTC 19937]